MANTGIIIKTTMTKTIVEIMVKDIKGKIEEKIS